ncbi:MAG: hypothetical protein ACI33K_14115 [Clostridiaceae bacterium]
MDKDFENSINESEESKRREETIVEREALVDDSSILKNEEDNKNSEEDTGFIQLFIANFADVTAISALTFIGIFLFKLLLKAAGWRVKAGSDIIIYLIAFIIMSLLYAPICAKTKLKATIGQKLFYLQLRKED